MAIAFDAATDGGNSQTTSVTSWTFSHTTSGSNRILFVGVTPEGSASDVITGITYAGVSMTRVAYQPQVGAQTYGLFLYMLVAPASGTNNVVISISPSTTFVGAVAASYTGAAQSGQPDATVTKTTAVAASLAISLTTIANNSWTLSYVDTANNQAITAGSGTIMRIAESIRHRAIGDSNGPITPAGATTLNFNTTPNDGWGGAMASFAPAPTVSAQTLMMMGIGS